MQEDDGDSMTPRRPCLPGPSLTAMARAGGGATGTEGSVARPLPEALQCGPARSEQEEPARTPWAPPGSAGLCRGLCTGLYMVSHERKLQRVLDKAIQFTRTDVPEIQAVNLTTGLDGDCPLGPEAPGPAVHLPAKLTCLTAAENFLADYTMTFLGLVDTWVTCISHGR